MTERFRSNLRVVFLGTPAFAVPTLRLLFSLPFHIVGVVTSLPKPQGRGLRVQPCPVHQEALNLGLPVYTLEKSGELLSIMNDLRPDVIVVVASRFFVASSVLSLPRWGCLNVHPSLLPRWRGSAPIQRALMAGDTYTGVSIMMLDKGWDTGPILAQEKIDIFDWDTSKTLENRLAYKGAEMMGWVLPEWIQGRLQLQNQPSEGIYAAKISKEDEKIDFSYPATQLHRCIRALGEGYGFWLQVGSVRVKVLEAAVVTSESPLGTIGHVVTPQGGIQCGQDILMPLQVQQAGRKILSIEAFLQGFPLPMGLRIE